MAIFTYHGCTLSVQGEVAVDYIAEETPMMTYLNLHLALDSLRASAMAAGGQQQGAKGPRVLIAGPDAAGKTSLCRTLLNYAVKMGRRPLHVDMDVVENAVFPGTLSAYQVTKPLSLEESIPPSDMPPITYFYGHMKATENQKMYEKALSRLAQTVNAKMASDALSTCFSIDANKRLC